MKKIYIFIVLLVIFIVPFSVKAITELERQALITQITQQIISLQNLLKPTANSCTPIWNCTNWSVCTDSGRYRKCTDVNKCGVTIDKPTEYQTCSCGTTGCSVNCTPNWSCDNWGACVNDKVIRFCTDKNFCATNLNKPETSKACCVPDWKCGDWGECSNGVKTRKCNDANLCGGYKQQDLPKETQDCPIVDGFRIKEVTGPAVLSEGIRGYWEVVVEYNPPQNIGSSIRTSVNWDAKNTSVFDAGENLLIKTGVTIYKGKFTHIFNAGGNYDVTFNVSVGDGKPSATITKQIGVQGKFNPWLNYFKTDKTAIYNGDTITFSQEISHNITDPLGYKFTLTCPAGITASEMKNGVETSGLSCVNPLIYSYVQGDFINRYSPIGLFRMQGTTEKTVSAKIQVYKMSNGEVIGEKSLSFIIKPKSTFETPSSVKFDSSWIPLTGIVGEERQNGMLTGNSSYFASVIIGLYNPAESKFYFRQLPFSKGKSASFVTSFGTPNAGMMPIMGDWIGNGNDSIGLYEPLTGKFYLKNRNSSGTADSVFQYGPANIGWIPLAGDWDGNGVDTVGLYDPKVGTFYLKNSNSGGNADYTFDFGVGLKGWIPIIGDWDGDGRDTVGVYDPSNGKFYLKNSFSPGAADIERTYIAGKKPIAGDWSRLEQEVNKVVGIDKFGVYNPALGTFQMRKYTDLFGTAKDFVEKFNPATSEWTESYVDGPPFTAR